MFPAFLKFEKRDAHFERFRWHTAVRVVWVNAPSTAGFISFLFVFCLVFFCFFLAGVSICLLGLNLNFRSFWQAWTIAALCCWQSNFHLNIGKIVFWNQAIMNLLQGITVNLDPICILSVMALIVFFLYVMSCNETDDATTWHFLPHCIWL